MTEYLELVTVPPQQLLSAIATRLKTCPRKHPCIHALFWTVVNKIVAIVQEPCLIALIRIRAHCDDVPSDIVDIVNDISRSGRQLVRLVSSNRNNRQTSVDLTAAFSAASNFRSLWQTRKDFWRLSMELDHIPQVALPLAAIVCSPASFSFPIFLMLCKATPLKYLNPWIPLRRCHALPLGLLDHPAH